LFPGLTGSILCRSPTPAAEGLLMQRRDFLKAVAAAGTLTALPPAAAAEPAARADPLLPTVELGKH
jgi:hypothetical protein